MGLGIAAVAGSSGHVIVVGYEIVCHNTGACVGFNWFQPFAARFDGSGNVVWQKRLVVGQFNAHFVTIASLLDGTFFVFGVTNTPGNFDYLGLKRAFWRRPVC